MNFYTQGCQFQVTPVGLQDAHRGRLVAWMKAAGGNATAFDMTTKGIMHQAFEVRSIVQRRGRCCACETEASAASLGEAQTVPATHAAGCGTAHVTAAGGSGPAAGQRGQAAGPDRVVALARDHLP